MPVSLKIDRNAGEMYIAIGPHDSTIQLPELTKTDFAPQLHFSMSRHMVESASFSIRVLTIIADGRTTLFRQACPLRLRHGRVEFDTLERRQNQSALLHFDDAYGIHHVERLEFPSFQVDVAAVQRT